MLAARQRRRIRITPQRLRAHIGGEVQHARVAGDHDLIDAPARDARIEGEEADQPVDFGGDFAVQKREPLRGRSELHA